MMNRSRRWPSLMSDPYVGQLIFIRVYSGILRKGDAVYNPVKGKKERIGRIVLMHANDRHEVDELRAGISQPVSG